jgi:large subunit ribosomal protein L13
MKSITSVSQNLIEEKWYLLDAEGQRIGLVASKAAELLQGKKNVLIRDYHDPKVKVVVINISKLDITPKKGITKFYKNYSGFPGGLRFQSLEEVMKSNPLKPIQSAVKGMLPKTKRASDMMANLKLFAGSEHAHGAQNPEKLDIRKLNI